MRSTFRSRATSLGLGLGLVAAAWPTGGDARAEAPAATIRVDAANPGVRVSPMLYGLMTEEINHAYDGGLLAELIQNRTFQDPGPIRDGAPIHWSVVGPGKVALDRDAPVNPALPVSLRLDLPDRAEAGVANDGYWGIPVRPNTTYTATFYARGGEGFAGPVTASLVVDAGDVVVARADAAPASETWRKYTVTLTTGADAPTTAEARFVLSAKGPGRAWFSFVSLFPPTYQGVPDGLRPDLMELMAGLRPRFIRLPGGNYLEGNRFSDRFRWKETIGPPDRRPGHMGCWGYRSSDGLGMPEFLLWCKQLGAEPVLGLFAGYVLNGDYVKAGTPEMALYTQEALEQIEYVAGPADSEWGRKRAEDGFPEPFPLRYVEIGNEDWFDKSGGYDGRFTQMAAAIRERYPHLKIIASAPVTGFKPDLYDDHFYRSPRQLFRMTDLYDPRPADAPPLKFEGGGFDGRQPDGIQTIVGEWAAHDGEPTPTLNAALSDAAFAMGLERNSDAVVMQCYAPLLANVSPADPARGYPRGWQWRTNLIGYDALRSYGSPSYHAQAMLAQNAGDVVLPVALDPPPADSLAESPAGAVGLGAWRTDVEYADLSVTAPDGRELLGPAQASEVRAYRSVGAPWKAQDGAIRPGAWDSETWAFLGDRAWTDYVINVRARKLKGREGFLIIWHAADDDHYRWWNVGGWENSRTQPEAADGGRRAPYGDPSPFRVETGRWYDLRLEVSGHRVRGYIDGQLVTDATHQPEPAPPPMVATATLDESDNAVLLKVVNAGRAPISADIDIAGVAAVAPEATILVLSGDPGAVNTVDEPTKVAPRRESIAASKTFRHAFPPHSFTIFRLKPAGR
ncbi:alpha-L-arabinofuranosidase C-terminal domain-containing protein [Paludisphaera sp.]|uniref:alpha-L-arabinofuranosidase C-terminal domain-containing protein n=1 Tax=Paludisphaera sp. TaxID=2017432 RepID=UPI00301CEAFA